MRSLADVIYREALLRLDMENMNNITNHQIDLYGSDVVGTGGCSEIRQVRCKLYILSTKVKSSTIFNNNQS